MGRPSGLGGGGYGLWGGGGGIGSGGGGGGVMRGDLHDPAGMLLPAGGGGAVPGGGRRDAREVHPAYYGGYSQRPMPAHAPSAGDRWV